MSMPLRVLLIEDCEDDAELVLHELRKAGYQTESRRVDSADSLRAALASGQWDIAISDHNIPGFSSGAALEMIKQTGQDIPFIIVSGSIGEDVAVAAMREGAQDYIMKDNLTRLAPAIERELRESQVRRSHREAEATIRHLAFHDPLTGLANRHQFEQAVLKALEKPGEHALLYLDLDQFKLVNDTCGHVAGDELLKTLAVMMNDQVRANDTLARLGGDEFGLLLERCPPERAVEVAQRLLDAIKGFRFAWMGKTFNLGGSIGLVSFTMSDANISDLLRSADIACYAAKDGGRNRIHVYSDTDADLRRRHGEMLWVSRINAALEEDRLVLFHQCIFCPDEKRGGGHFCEVLIRMRDEEGNLVPPGAFLPAAERYNLAPAIDRWVVKNVCESLSQIDQFGQEDAYYPAIIFINISGTTLNDHGFFGFVRDQLQQNGIPPSRLCFEITETAAIANLNRAVEFIQSFRAEGCHFALDDFGAGLSSFSYLKAIPVDFLKIDGSFVREILNDPMNRAIVESINHIGHVVGLKTIAEFVENEVIYLEVKKIGIDYAQGYGLHEPEPLASRLERKDKVC